MNALITIKSIKSKEVTGDMLCLALLQDMGCSCSGYDIKGKEEGNIAYSDDIEWFDPFKVDSLEEYYDLPEYWQAIFRNANRECWRCGYRYVHVPENIICRYPHTPIKGIFVVVNGDATPETVVSDDLMHGGGQFVEYDTKDKGVWMDQIDGNKGE
jgi:hypothetical protein